VQRRPTGLRVRTRDGRQVIVEFGAHPVDIAENNRHRQPVRGDAGVGGEHPERPTGAVADARGAKRARHVVDTGCAGLHLVL
jgi:hypothetical protein